MDMVADLKADHEATVDKAKKAQARAKKLKKDLEQAQAQRREETDLLKEQKEQAEDQREVLEKRLKELWEKAEDQRKALEENVRQAEDKHKDAEEKQRKMAAALAEQEKGRKDAEEKRRTLEETLRRAEAPQQRSKNWVDNTHDQDDAMQAFLDAEQEAEDAVLNAEWAEVEMRAELAEERKRRQEDLARIRAGKRPILPGTQIGRSSHRDQQFALGLQGVHEGALKGDEPTVGENSHDQANLHATTPRRLSGTRLRPDTQAQQKPARPSQEEIDNEVHTRISAAIAEKEAEFAKTLAQKESEIARVTEIAKASASAAAAGKTKEKRKSQLLKITTQPPKFEGTNIVHHLRRFEDYARTMRWDDDDKMFNYISCVDPTLSEKVYDIGESAADWPSMKEALTVEYCKNDLPVQQEDLEKMLLKDYATFDKYITQYEEAAARAPMVNEDLKTLIFLQQFPVELTSVIIDDCGPKVTWALAKKNAESPVPRD
jgi:hypothetical protein